MGARRLAVRGFLAGVAAFALLAGGGSAWASWTASAQGTAQVTTPSVSVTQTNFNVLRATYTNSANRQTMSGSFTITNTGSVPGVATTTISSTGTAGRGFPIRMWLVPSAASCSLAAVIPDSAVSGTWALTTIAGTSLAAGQSQIFCVRTTVPVSQRNALASPTGSLTAPGTLTVSLASAETGWTAASAPASAPQTTQAIYPLDASLAPATTSRWFAFRAATNSNACLDVAASGSAGSTVISWACVRTAEGLPQANELWQVVPVSEADPTLVAIRPRHAPTTRLAVDANGRQIIAAVNSAAPAQQWYVQRASSTTVQFVSAVDGRCLALPATTGNGALSLAECTSAATVLVTPERIPLGFSTSAQSTSLTVGPSVSGAGLTLQRWTGAAWTDIASASGSVITFSQSTSLAAGDNSLRIVFPDGSVAYTLTLSLTNGVVTPSSGVG